jgi:hypothetical protein
MHRTALKEAVNSRYWGPGCFAKALAEAVGAGTVTRTGRNRFALSGDGADSNVPFVTGEKDRSGHR